MYFSVLPPLPGSLARGSSSLLSSPADAEAAAPADEAAAGAGVYDRPRIFNVKEMEGKLRLTSSKIAARLASTAAAGLKAPRLEEMRSRLALDAFEVNVVVYLAGVTISPTIKSIISDQAAYENRQATTG